MNNSSTRTSLFLIELVLSIFFFIVAATVCMQLFVNTFFLSNKTIETNQALLWSQNLAEPFLGNQGDYSIVKNLYANINCLSELSIKTDSALLLCFDKDWNNVSTLADSKYVVFSTSYTDEKFSYQDIYIAKTHDSFNLAVSISELTELLYNDEHSIYQLSVKKFISTPYP